MATAFRPFRANQVHLNDDKYHVSCYRARRRRLQSPLDNPGIHADIPLLEGAPSPAVDTSERLFDLRYAAVVEHCERYSALKTRDETESELSISRADLLDHRETPILTF